MKIWDNVVEGVRNRMRNFLQLQEGVNAPITIIKGIDGDTKLSKNIIWYRGDSFELSQLYSQLQGKEDTFWGAVQTADIKLRKIHTGIPSLIVDTLTTIVISDYNGLTFEKNKDKKEKWEEIEKENKFEKILEEAVCQGLYKGTGAFKISFDKEISTNPILEYYPKDRIEVIKKRGRVQEIVFLGDIYEDNKKYILKEYYGYGYIKYKLFDNQNKEVPLNFVRSTKGLEDVIFENAKADKEGNITEKGTFMLAELFKINEDAIYDKKTDNFDSVDEVWSQWMDALRAGRTKEYIPESLIPKNPKNGALLKPNSFDNKFLVVENDSHEDGKDKIITVQGNFKTDGYVASYITALDQALQGIISPATLGIDTKKLTEPNASFQREKEKVTLWTRGKIVNAINETIPSLVNKTLKAVAVMQKAKIEEVEVGVSFGEYANPSFEAQVETVGKGKTQGVMSIEASVEELYGDSKTEEWKKEEVARLKAEQGIVEVEQPQVNPTAPVNNVDNKTT
jgi:hypothetical protein